MGGDVIEKARRAIAKDWQATGAFIIHLDGKRNANTYWETRGAAEEARDDAKKALDALLVYAESLETRLRELKDLDPAGDL